jgi:hypothetical protein
VWILGAAFLPGLDSCPLTSRSPLCWHPTLYLLQVRELIYREILEYHPQMLADYLAGGHRQVRGSAVQCTALCTALRTALCTAVCSILHRYKSCRAWQYLEVTSWEGLHGTLAAGLAVSL